MAQTSNTSFNERTADPAKALEYAFVIAGWPTIYTMNSAGHTLAGDLANFTAQRNWLTELGGSAGKFKGRPEEGQTTIGQLDVGIVDKVDAGVRAISDLMSRQAYIEGTSTGYSTTLTGNHTRTVTTITVASTTNFPTSGQIHIGQECINYTGVTATTFTTCTRGYLLTDKNPHRANVKVYSFMPSLYRRLAYLYKGFQGLGPTSWLKAYGGPIVGEGKDGSVVTLEVMGQTWEMYKDGNMLLMRKVDVTDLAVPDPDILKQDYTGIVINVNKLAAATLNNGHYIWQVGSQMFPVRSAT